ncbi:hypothetical protein GN156_08420 [bacterium LRH843]|nr:hypothetical protein [bacterium LRH843]
MELYKKIKNEKWKGFSKTKAAEKIKNQKPEKVIRRGQWFRTLRAFYRKTHRRLKNHATASLIALRPQKKVRFSPFSVASFNSLKTPNQVLLIVEWLQ